MTYNSQLVLNLLKKNFGKEFTKKEIADTLGISMAAVTGSVNGLTKREYAVERIETVETTTDSGKVVLKSIRHVQLTEAGLAYDPIAEEEAKQADKEAKAAARAAERAAKKAAKEAAGE